MKRVLRKHSSSILEANGRRKTLFLSENKNCLPPAEIFGTQEEWKYLTNSLDVMMVKKQQSKPALILDRCFFLPYLLCVISVME